MNLQKINLRSTQVNKFHTILELDKIVDLVCEELILKKNEQSLHSSPLLSTFNTIEWMLDTVDEAVVLTQRMGRFPLYFHDDLEPLLTKVHKYGVLSTAELLQIGNLLDSIKSNFVYLEKLENSKISAAFFTHYLNQLTYHKELNLRIKEIIDPYGEVKDDASSHLKEIRRKQKEIERNIKNKLQECIQKNTDKLSQTTISIRNDRYVLAVKNDYKNTLKGIVHDQSASKETVFIEPTAIYVLSNELNEKKEEEKEEIFRILREASLLINDVFESLTQSYHILLELDIIFAKASYAIKIDAKKPRINKNHFLNLEQCFHPLLNVEHVIKNNIVLGKDYQGIIITGPNTGGKTVLLKTIGLLSLMVQAGMLIPASENSDVMIFDNVFADIGDEQSIYQNLSTFSSHLKNVIHMMNQVTPNSLVLLDELGSGTDPAEGASLAIGIFDYLIDQNCLVIATSHYSELKMHAFHSKKLINASVEFDEMTLQPTYKLLIGVPGMSNALKIASNLGLKEEVLAKANAYLFTKNDNLNLMLQKLIQQSHQLDNKIKENEEKLNILTKKENEIESLKQTIQDKESMIITQANQKASELIARSMHQMEELLNDLKATKNKAVSLPEIADLTHRIRDLQQTQISGDHIQENKEIELDDTVYVKSYDCYGKVLKILNNNKYEILVGNASLKLDKKNLLLAKPIAIKQEPRTSGGISLRPQVSSSLDLRGKRYEEAKDMIEAYMDQAVYAGLQIVSIIHGYGTGTIRKLVQEILKTNSHVEEYRYGGQNEGGMGATVVTLKK